MPGLGIGLGVQKLLNTAASFAIGQISSLVLWLDGNADTINGGGAVPTDPIATWLDQSSNADTYSQGTSTARPTYAALTPNSADFDGNSDFYDITAALTSYLSTSTKGFWCMWVRPTDATPSAAEILVAFGDTNSTTRIYLLQEATTGKLRALGIASGVIQWDVVVDTSTLSDATWAHIALVQDGISPVLYVDGVAVAQTFNTPTDKTVWFNTASMSGLDNGRIGCLNYNSAGNSNFFNGAIDQVLIGNDEITAATVVDIYNSGLSSHP